jgi:hypothetical protein
MTAKVKARLIATFPCPEAMPTNAATNTIPVSREYDAQPRRPSAVNLDASTKQAAISPRNPIPAVTPFMLAI